MPLVSVIIPNYNHAPFLRQRIESVLDQTFRDFEVIILDDNSQDDSRSIIESYRGHEKVSHIILNEFNSGSTFLQWKKGFDLAAGALLWIAESDDWCEPNFLETLVKPFETDPQMALALLHSVWVNDDGSIMRISKAGKLESTMPGALFVTKHMLEWNEVYNASMCIFKKSLLEFVPPQYQDFKFCGDWFFWIRIAAQGNVYISGRVLNYFRKHQANVSGSALNNGLLYYEYFKLADFFLQWQLADEVSYKKLLHKKFLYFLNDPNLAPAQRPPIRKLFADKLGNLNRYSAAQKLRKLVRFFSR